MSLSPRKHWLALRGTAILSIPLCIWFVYSVLQLVNAEYDIVRAWLIHPINASLMIITLLFTTLHAQLGVEEIVEDYVHAPALKKLTLSGLKLAFLAVAAAAIYAVVRIAFLGG